MQAAVSGVCVAALLRVRAKLCATGVGICNVPRAVLNALQQSPLQRLKESAAGYIQGQLAGSSKEQKKSEHAGELSLEEHITRIDHLFEGNELSIAYKQLKELNTMSNPEVSWRFTKVCIEMVRFKATSVEEKDRLLAEGKEAIQQSLQTHGESSTGKLWLAAVIGAEMQTHTSHPAMLSRLREVWSNLQDAVELDSTNWEAWHMMGTLIMEIRLSLGPVMRRMLRIFAPEINTSFEEALGFLMRANKENPKPNGETWLMIAKCHLNNGNKEEGLRWLQDIVDGKSFCMPSPSMPNITQEAASLLQDNLEKA